MYEKNYLILIIVSKRIGNSLTLHRTLCVPYFQFNFLSVKRPSEQLKCQVVFLDHSCVLQAPSLNWALKIGKSTQGLYILDEEIARRLVLKK